MNNEEVERLDLTGWPLPDSYLLEIGRVTAIWASLESLLNVCLGKLAGFNDLSDPKPFILVNHSSFPQRLDMLGALCEQLTPNFPSLANYEATISALRNAQKERNKFAHNGASLDEQTGEIIMAVGSARGRLKTSVQKVRIADVRRAAISIHDAQRSLYKLVLGRDIAPISERLRNSQ